MPLTVRYVLSRDFTPRERVWIASVLNDPVRGWNRVFRTRFEDATGESRPRNVSFRMSKLPDAGVRRKYPGFGGLSLTDFRTAPISIVLNRNNWDAVPKDSRFARLEDYRRYLVNHEVGHAVFFLEHRNVARPEYRCASIMGQQTVQNHWDPDHVLTPNPHPALGPELRSQAKWLFASHVPPRLRSYLERVIRARE